MSKETATSRILSQVNELLAQPVTVLLIVWLLTR